MIEKNGRMGYNENNLFYKHLRNMTTSCCLHERNVAMKQDKKQYAVEIGRRIREWRTENGMEVRQLAEIVGISERSVSGWELGEFCPGYNALMRLADSMGVSADWLMGRCHCWKTADQLLKEYHIQERGTV